jgi:hypothetical protein
MLMPMGDVPRWHAERKPKDAVAVSHGTDLLTWEALERGANRRGRAFAAFVVSVPFVVVDPSWNQLLGMLKSGIANWLKAAHIKSTRSRSRDIP